MTNEELIKSVEPKLQDIAAQLEEVIKEVGMSIHVNGTVFAKDRLGIKVALFSENSDSMIFCNDITEEVKWEEFRA